MELLTAAEKVALAADVAVTVMQKRMEITVPVTAVLDPMSLEAEKDKGLQPESLEPALYIPEEVVVGGVRFLIQASITIFSLALVEPEVEALVHRIEAHPQLGRLVQQEQVEAAGAGPQEGAIKAHPETAVPATSSSHGKEGE